MPAPLPPWSLSSPGVIELPDRPAWYADALCAGVHARWFFPTRGEIRPEPICNACAVCPVSDSCLTEAMTSLSQTFGVWGGVSDRGRRILRSRGEFRSHRLHAIYDAETGDAVVEFYNPPAITTDEARAALAPYLTDEALAATA